MKVKKIALIRLLTLGILLVPARCLLAGEIVGIVKVSKPSQMIVYLEKVRGKFEPQRVIMDQKEMVFIPYVLPVVKGSTVEFHNSDNMYHSVFGVGAEEFNLGNFVKGISRSHSFNKTGEVAILCEQHPEMEAYILVLENPFFVSPDALGNFTIQNVPEGQYVLRAWYRGKTMRLPGVVSTASRVVAGF